MKTLMVACELKRFHKTNKAGNIIFKVFKAYSAKLLTE